VAEVIQNLLHKKTEPIYPQTRLSQVILKALEKDPDSRFQSASEMRSVLIGETAPMRDEDSTESEVTTSLTVKADRPVVLFAPVAASDNLSDLAENLFIAANTRLGGSTAMALLSPLAYQGESSISLERAQQLGADYVLASQLRKSGSRTRLNLSLVDVQSKEQTWSEHLDIQSYDLLEIEDQSVAWMGERIYEYFSGAPGRGVNDWEPKLALLREKTWAGDREALERAIEGVQSMSIQHPGQSRIEGTLANLYLQRSSYSQRDFDVCRPLALACIEKCLGADSRCYLGLLARAKSYITPFAADWAKADSQWREAFRVAPLELELSIWRAYFDIQNGECEKGILRAQKLLETLPGSPACLSAVSLGYLSQGNARRASEVANSLLRLRPGDSVGLSLVLMSDVFLGLKSEGVRFSRYLAREYEKIRLRGYEDFLLEALLFVAQALDDPDQAKQRTHTTEPRLLASRVSARVSMTGFAMLEAESSVRACMERLVETNFRNIPYLMNDPHLRDYRNRDWFQEGLAKLATGF